MRRLAVWFVVVLLLVAVSSGFWVVQHAKSYLQTPLQVQTAQQVDVERGWTLPELLNHWHAEGWLATPGWRLKVLLKLEPKWAAIRAGTYEINPHEPLRAVLTRLLNNEEYQFSITFVEGSTFSEWREQLAHAPKLTDDINHLSNAQVAALLKIKQDNPEGWLFPETYHYTADTQASQLLLRAHQRMRETLTTLWEKRGDKLPLKTPYEALILASIIEKETGAPHERPQIASVFINRLRKHMRLQTDPTVIYGLGDQYKGNLTRHALRQHTPYNTYVINGLPPTPIAMPGRPALAAVMHPADTPYFYFVAKGDGTHQFSQTLAQHNKAVRRYQLHR